MRKELLATIPDEPRWVELRGTLLEAADDDLEILGRCDACVVVEFGGDGNPERHGVMFVVGVPERDVLESAIAIDPEAETIIFRETLVALEKEVSTTARRVVVHTQLAAPELLKPTTRHRTTVLDVADRARLDAIPLDLRAELLDALPRVPIAAALSSRAEDDGAFVSFCYPGATTESLWDIAVDTLDTHQRQGYAAAAVARMIELEAIAKRRPVWQAEAANAASMGLARKLGFTAVDELFVCSASALRAR